jgi:imidazolonepropionase-like amidohydrolase
VVADGVVLVDATGVVRAIGPVDQVFVPADVRHFGHPGAWVGPGVIDAHVHLAFVPNGPTDVLPLGIVGARDLGAPPAASACWRCGDAARAGSPRVWAAGPLLTAPDGYPSRSWGAAGFTRALEAPDQARGVVRALVDDGVDLVKVALEERGGQPAPTLAQLRAVVDAAHAAGLAVTAHALSVAMVGRALDAGVDELCHVPAEPLPPQLVERVAAAGVGVVSTIATFASVGRAAGVRANAAALHSAGVALVYGTDLGNAGTRPGVDPRELDRLAAAGLGPLGALRAATEGSGTAVGVRGLTGRLEVGGPVAAVVLDGDPTGDPELWRRPVATLVDRQLAVSSR